jgi:hypothetical protein
MTLFTLLRFISKKCLKIYVKIILIRETEADAVYVKIGRKNEK